MICASKGQWCDELDDRANYRHFCSSIFPNQSWTTNVLSCTMKIVYHVFMYLMYKIYSYVSHNRVLEIPCIYRLTCRKSTFSIYFSKKNNYKIFWIAIVQFVSGRASYIKLRKQCFSSFRSSSFEKLIVVPRRYTFWLKGRICIGNRLMHNFFILSNNTCVFWSHPRIFVNSCRWSRKPSFWQVLVYFSVLKRSKFLYISLKNEQISKR